MSGKPLGKVRFKMNKIFTIEEITKIMNERIVDFKTAEQKIVLQVSSTEKAKKDNSVILKSIGDISLVLSVIIDDDILHTVDTVKVLPKTINKWREKNNIYQTALNNTIEKYPATIQRKNEKPKKILKIRKLKNEIYSLNNPISIFFPNVREKIAELYGNSFHIAFLSESEVVIEPVTFRNSVDIKKKIKKINHIFGFGITNFVYFYDIHTKELKIV